ncbi:unnamed protein product [Moneuplotes crassus]|uniref:Uncharacterized protein n=1 Tax=Euplotes crassus TaxID=5936 RepID=A0AAD1UF56_EUPCR|nr:unnamed protein product [Moneuplotes crassus]
MGFEEIREQLNYLHRKRDYSKRKNKFEISDEKENNINDCSISASDCKGDHRSSSLSLPARSRRGTKAELQPNPSMMRKLRSNGSPNSKGMFTSYVPEKDPKNKARYLPPSKLKKGPANYQGRRTVKFKEESDYSMEYFGPIKKEKKPAPKKIMCVTEIMVDLSESETSVVDDYDETTSQEKPLPSSSSDNPTVNCASLNESATKSSDSKNMLPPDKWSFIFNVRKRSQKGREKEEEENKESKISKSLIDKIHKQKDIFRMPPAKTNKKSLNKKQERLNRNLEALIYKKFNNRKSVSKILQKTAKLQKNIDRKVLGEPVESQETGDAIRHCMMKRIKGFQMARAGNYNRKERTRGKIDAKHLKLKYQSYKQKRKTKNFNLFSLKQLDFPDANNLLKKKLYEYEFDNDVESDHDEITKTCYVRLKDLTISLKEHLEMGEMYDNDDDDIAIKEHVGYSN